MPGPETTLVVGPMTAFHIVLSGRVQGVGFRWFAESLAGEYAVTGYVRNLADGRVEILAQADEEILKAFCEALRRGPSWSRVVNVSIKRVPMEPDLRGFQIRF
ncbi:MAG: acylphosphatase [Acidobacteriota bacterium]